jgi:hypothetical protein
LLWRVARDNGNCGTTVSSTSGEFRTLGGSAPNTLLGTVATPLFQSQACPPPPSTTLFQFSEAVIVPADALQRANKLGSSQIVYRRTFNDGFGPTAGSISLNITSPLAAGFGVTREALSFDNGAPVRVLPLKEALQAQAEVGYNGSGLLQAIWEVAGPASTAGEPIYRPLLQVRRQLVAGDSHTFNSPSLPTDATGLYLVRLRITDPAPAFETPLIRYFVGQGRPGRELPAEPIALTAPPPLGLLASDTAFAWETIKGARAYQLEIYATRREPADALPDLGGEERAPKPAEAAAALARAPVTGTLVPGRQTRATLSGTVRRHLPPGQAYFWRVLAIGEDGAVIGQSAMRELRTP